MFQKTVTMATAASTSATTQRIQWTREDEKLFGRAIVMVPENLPNRWEKIAEQVPSKSAAEARDHYDDLERDIWAIESGMVEIPEYPDDLVVSGGSESSDSDSGGESCDSDSSRKKEKKIGHADKGTRKIGKPWTEDEHKLFLAGLEKYGKGDWKSISRKCVVTRTPTQVASHAQKYFSHLQEKSAGKNKGRKRSSIHDITLGDSSSIPVPIDQNRVPPSGVGSLQQPQEMHYYPSNSLQDQMGSFGHSNYGF